jgi:hypothetical protein
MKKLLIMVSALTAAVFSSAKADISVSGSAGLAMISGGNVLDGDASGSRSTSGTLFQQGGAISFSMSTTSAGGLTVSAGAGITMDSNDRTDAKAVSGLAQLTFAADGFSLTVGDIDLPGGDGVGEVGFVASAQVDNGGYTQTGIVTGVSDTEGYGFTASTSVGSASLTFGYLLDKAPEGINNAESASGDYGSGVTLAMPMGDMSVTLGYANVTGTADETTAGVAVSYGLGGGTLKVGYESTDEATDSSTVAASFSGSLDADTTYAIGYTDGEQGSLASTATEVAIVRSLGGGVSVFAEIQSLDGSGTSGTNMAVGTTVAF